MDTPGLRLSHALLLAVPAGIALVFATGLHPLWWWAWLAPILLLWLACSIERRRDASLAVALASLIGAASYCSYFQRVMPLPAVVAATIGEAALWWVVVMNTRRIARRLGNGWAVLAYPLLWIAADTLSAALLPDGNWGSLAYSQADVAQVLQLAALGGTAAIMFVLCLPASAVALLLWRGQRVRRPMLLLGVVIVLVATAIGYGQWRLHTPVAGPSLRIGLASIDDPVGAGAKPEYWQPIRAGYDAQVASLAMQGAKLVLLPEKIAVRPRSELDAWQTHFAALARQHGIWLAVGIGVQDPQPRNRLWLFDPRGQRVADYEKHFAAPPERAEHYAVGNAYVLQSIAGHAFGLAICKDMHFARFGLAYGERDAAVVLVPAWDFAYVDAWMAERMTAMRGVENGYAIVRSSREGLLSVSDAHGRLLAEQRSAPLPGSTMIADLPLAPPIATPYTRFGHLFGWLCTLAALVLLLAPRSRRRSA